MPTITPVIRQVIGATSEDSFRQPRKTISATTGMDIAAKQTPVTTNQSNETTQVSQNAQTSQPGQTNISEDTSTKEVTLASKYTAIARKEQKSLERENLLKVKEAEWKAKEADYIPKSALKDKLKANAGETLRELGLDYNELTELLLNQQNTADPVKKLEAEIENLKSAQEKNVSTQYEATVAQYRKEIQSLVAKDESLITIKEENAEAVVLQHILDTFEKDGEILTVEEASKDIEDYLIEEAMKKISLTKVKAKMSMAAPTTQEQKKILPPPQRNGLRTLTNQIDTSPNRRDKNQFQFLSEKQRIAQAIARATK